MHKILVIAVREYVAAVKTKSFLITLILMPVLMGGSAVVQTLLRKQSNLQARTFVVVDRTPGSKIFPLLKNAATRRAEKTPIDPETGKPARAAFLLERATLDSDDPAEVNKLRLQLSDRARNDEIWGFVEIGPDALRLMDPSPPPEDRAFLRYQTNHPTFEEFPTWLQNQLIIALSSLSAGAAPEAIEQRMENQRALLLRREGLTVLDTATGEFKDPTTVHQIARFIVPAGLVALMFMIVMLSTTPAMQGVVEEKMQRIAEVLLGSVAPFRLMMGKLLGLLGVSLTVAAVYLAGAYWAAGRYEFLDFLPPKLIAWYLLFQALAVFMYGSIFLAIGAAATDIKETQTLVMPVMLVACLPMFILGNALEDPNQPFVVAMSFFPPASPMLMVARLAIPPGPPLWQPVLAVVLVLALTFACVWAAGRIFRVGILMQGKGARIGQMVQWIVRG
jgi:ABC-2 type transport system permease protein